jgi:hypothetical protein
MAPDLPPFLADENFNNDLLRALLRRLPDLDIIRVQDTVIAGATDPDLLTWAADAGRILLTHDVRTIPHHAYVRVRAGSPLPGVVVIAAAADLGTVLDDSFAMIVASLDEEWPDQVRFIPLR